MGYSRYIGALGFQRVTRSARVLITRKRAIKKSLVFLLLYRMIPSKNKRDNLRLSLLFGSPCKARTYDPAVNSRMLYRLS